MLENGVTDALILMSHLFLLAFFIHLNTQKKVWFIYLYIFWWLLCFFFFSFLFFFFFEFFRAVINFDFSATSSGSGSLSSTCSYSVSGSLSLSDSSLCCLLWICLYEFQYKMSKFLWFRCKVNTSRIVKTCLFRFSHDYYGDSLDVMFPQFPNHSLPFLIMVFPHVSPGVPALSSSVSTVSPQCFPRFLF